MADIDKIKVGNNTYDISATKLAKTDTVLQTDKVPYVARQALSPEGFSGYIREKIDGGSVGWNQIVYNGNFNGTTNWGTTETGTTISASNNVLTVSSTTDGNMYSSQTFTTKTVTGHKYIFNAEAYSDYTSNLIVLYTGSSDAGRTEFTNTVTGKFVQYNKIFECPNQNSLSQIRLLNRQHSSSNKFKNVYIVDLTLMLGATIADYLYNLESSTAGAGVSLLRSLGFFTKPYYAQDNGSVQSVCVKEKKITGKNLVESEIESANINSSGTIVSGTTRLCIARVIINQQYTISWGSDNSAVYAFYPSMPTSGSTSYDGARVAETNTNHYKTITAPINGYIVFRSGGSYTQNQCEPGSSKTDFEPYYVDTIPLSVTDLRGFPKLDSNNNIHFDGDEYTSDGKIKRKYGIVNLGTLDWYYNSYGYFYATLPYSKEYSATRTQPLVCSKYVAVYDGSSFDNTPDKSVYTASVSSAWRVCVKDSAYTNAATFKAAMDGVYLVYERATPTEETALAYQNPQYSMGGTEEFVDGKTRDMIVTVGHVTEYMGATAGEYQYLPTMPVDDGKYVLTADNKDVIWERKGWKFYNQVVNSSMIRNDILTISDEIMFVVHWERSGGIEYDDVKVFPVAYLLNTDSISGGIGFYGNANTNCFVAFDMYIPLVGDIAIDFYNWSIDGGAVSSNYVKIYYR